VLTIGAAVFYLSRTPAPTAAQRASKASPAASPASSPAAENAAPMPAPALADSAQEPQMIVPPPAAPLAADMAPMAAPPGAVEALLEIGGEPWPLTPNQAGVFIPRPEVAPGTKIPVTVRFAEAQPGEKIVAATQHGGALGEGKPVLVLPLDAERQARFDFTTGESRGVYHITVRHGSLVRVLEVWAGEPIPLAQSQP
jgi:hypothetical protein